MVLATDSTNFVGIHAAVFFSILSLLGVRGERKGENERGRNKGKAGGGAKKAMQ